MREIELKVLNETIYYDTCDNGLKVYMWVNKRVNSFYGTLSVKYGSIHKNFKIGSKTYKMPFLSTFDILAPKGRWVYRTAAEIVEILNEKYRKLNLSSAAFGKTLIPKLERRFSVEFTKKIVSGRQLRRCPPLSCDVSIGDRLSENLKIDTPKINRYEEFSEYQENSDIEF